MMTPTLPFLVGMALALLLGLAMFVVGLHYVNDPDEGIMSLSGLCAFVGGVIGTTALIALAEAFFPHWRF